MEEQNVREGKKKESRKDESLGERKEEREQKKRREGTKGEKGGSEKVKTRKNSAKALHGQRFPPPSLHGSFSFSLSFIEC